MDTGPVEPASASKACPRCGRTLEAWAKICPDCLHEGPQPGDAPPALLDSFEAAQDGPPGPCWAVYGLVGANLLVFLAQALAGQNLLTPDIAGLIRWGGNFPPLTVQGQWWRMLAATFLHAGILHIGFNLYILWAAGRRMERILGTWAFLAAYLLSGLLGSVASLLVHPTVVCVGASGAIFGIFGAMLGVLARDRAAIAPEVRRAILKNTLAFLGYNLLFGLSVKQVDLAAHAGGVLGGFLSGLALAAPAGGTDRRGLRRSAATFLAGLAVVGLLSGAVARMNPSRYEVGLDAVPRAALEERFQAMVQEELRTRNPGQPPTVESVRFSSVGRTEAFGTARVRYPEGALEQPLHVQVEKGLLRWELRQPAP